MNYISIIQWTLYIPIITSHNTRKHACVSYSKSMFSFLTWMNEPKSKVYNPEFASLPYQICFYSKKQTSLKNYTFQLQTLNNLLKMRLFTLNKTIITVWAIFFPRCSKYFYGETTRFFWVKLLRCFFEWMAAAAVWLNEPCHPFCLQLPQKTQFVRRG